MIEWRWYLLGVALWFVVACVVVYVDIHDGDQERAFIKETPAQEPAPTDKR